MPSTSTTDPRPLPEMEHELDALLVRYAEVKLRRRAACLSLKRGIYERRLLTFALAAVEAAAVRGA